MTHNDWIEGLFEPILYVFIVVKWWNDATNHKLETIAATGASVEPQDVNTKYDELLKTYNVWNKE